MFWTITPRPPIIPRSRNRIAAGGLFRYGQPNRCFARRRCRSGRGAGPAFRRDARALARPRGVAVRRRCERAVDARRIACQLASRAHELVLRNLRAARPCARLSPVRRSLPLSLPQLLLGGGAAPPPPAARSEWRRVGKGGGRK